MLASIVLDVRFALRWLGRSPGFAVVAVASLAVGIAFNTTVFSLADAVLFRPLPVRAPEELVDVFISASDGDQYCTSSYPDFLDVKAQNEVFGDMLGFSPMIATQNLEDRSRLLLGEVVTGNYFQMLGVGALLGRTLTPDDDRVEAERVVMVSHRYWQRELGGTPDAIGQTMRLRGQVYTVVGVSPSWFHGLAPVLSPQIWLPLARVTEVEPAGIQETVPSPIGTSRLDRRGQRWMFIKGRLAPGTTAAAAEANLRVLMARLEQAHPETNLGRRLSAIPTNEVRMHPAANQALRPVAAGLMVAVGLALLIVCANVASMLLARASARARELAVRQSVGATRWQLIRQLLIESVVLAALGGAGGVTLTWWLTRTLTTLDLPLPMPLSLDLQVDGRVLAFTLGVTVLAGLLAGLAPALSASRADLMRELHASGGRPVLVARRWTLRDLLVAAQIGVAMVLLVSGGLLARSLSVSESADVGFDPNGLVVVSTDPAMAGYSDERSREFWERAVERVRALPLVEHVALASRLPFSINFSNTSLHIPEHNTPGDAGTTVGSARVSEAYFSTIGLRIVEGRAFARSDTPDTPRVGIVNQVMARRFWPGRSAVGQRVFLRDGGNVPVEIVGVVADHRVRTVGEPPTPQVYFAQSQRPVSYQVLAARVRGDAEQQLGEVRRTLLAMEPNLVFLDSQTMATQVEATLLPVRAGALLVGVVGVVGSVLAAVGLYGVIAYSVARRTREIGIRLAIGCAPGGILGLVLRQGLAVAAAGLGFGVLLAAGAASAMAGALYGVGVADPLAWGGAVVALVCVALLANAVPAWRAARLDPVRALRTE